MVYSYKLTLKKENTKEALNITSKNMFNPILEENFLAKDHLVFSMVLNDLDLIKEFKTFGFNLIVKDVKDNFLVIECNSYRKLKDLLDFIRIVFKFDLLKKIEDLNDFYKYVLGLENFSSDFTLNKLMFRDHLNHNEKFKEIFNYFKLNKHLIK